MAILNGCPAQAIGRALHSQIRLRALLHLRYRVLGIWGEVNGDEGAHGVLFVNFTDNDRNLWSRMVRLNINVV